MGQMTGKETKYLLFFSAVDRVIIAKGKDYAEYTTKIILPKMGLKCNYSQNRVFIGRKRHPERKARTLGLN